MYIVKFRAIKSSLPFSQILNDKLKNLKLTLIAVFFNIVITKLSFIKRATQNICEESKITQIKKIT